MSKRGNPDYYKTAGHAAEDVDTGEQAKRLFTQSRRVWMRGAAPWTRPQPPARKIDAPPIHEGGLPWRVRREQPPLSVVAEDAQPHPWRTRAVRLALRAVLAPAHAALSIADALVERVMWRLEREA